MQNSLLVKKSPDEFDAMIIGISLVVNELHKGQRLVFRYPPTPSFVQFGKAASHLEKIFDQYNTAISDQNFAKLFRPKNTLCGKVFELEIDDLHFISFPCPCSPDSASTSAFVGGDAVSEGRKLEVITLFNIVITSISRKSMRKIDPTFLYRCQRGRQMSAFSASCSLPSADPIAAAMALPDSTNANGICSQVLKRVVEGVSNSLLQQEKKANYLSSEVGLLFRIIALSHDLHQKLTLNSIGDSWKSAYLNEMTIGLDALLRGDSVGAAAPSSSLLTISTSPRVHPKPLISPNDNSSDGFDLSEVKALSPMASNVNILSLGDAGSGINAFTSPAPGNQSMQVVSPIGGGNMGLSSANSRINANANANVANSNTSSTGSSNSSGGGSAAVAEGDEIISWGAHLLPVALKYSTLANELRILYHNLVGGHSVCIAFNGHKALNIPLVCKEVRLCNDSNFISRLNSNSEGFSYGNNPWGARHREPSTYSPSQEVIRGITGGASSPLTGGHTLHAIASGNASVTRGDRANLTSSQTLHSGDYSNGKFRGISLSTQTMLPMADADTIMSVLYFLDGSEVTQPVPGGGDRKGQLLPSGEEKKSRLYTFIEAADPTLCFIDLSIMLDEPVEELVSMASYLQSWGLAQIMTVIYSHSTYRVHESAETSSQSRVARIFSTFILSKLGEEIFSSEEKVSVDGDKALPRIDLTYVLSLFNGRTSISSIIEVLPPVIKDFALDILVFLLRYHLLRPVNLHVLNMRNLRTHLDRNSTSQEDSESTLSTGDARAIGHPNQSSSMLRNVSFGVGVKEEDKRLNSSFYLNEAENLAYERILPFVQQHVFSSKNIHEIMLFSKVSEKEFYQIVSKIPHFKIVAL